MHREVLVLMLKAMGTDMLIQTWAGRRTHTQLRKITLVHSTQAHRRTQGTRFSRLGV